MKKVYIGLTACVMTLGFLSTTFNAQADNSLAVEKIIINTDENDSFYGDSVRVIFNKPINRANWADFRITALTSLPKAPAGYTTNHSAKSAAKNYSIEILVEEGSTTRPFIGTWADLGGSAIFDKYDPKKKTVILIPPSKKSNFFSPGDKVKVTVASTLVDPENNKMNTSKVRKTKKAS